MSEEFKTDPELHSVEKLCAKFLHLKLQEDKQFLDETNKQLTEKMHAFDINFNKKMVNFAPQLIQEYIKIYNEKKEINGNDTNEKNDTNNKQQLNDKLAELQQLIEIALSKDGLQIGGIYKPSERQKMLAAASNPNSILLMEDVSDDLLALAVKKTPSIIKLFPNRSESCYIKAITFNCEAILFIKNPTFEMEAIAINKGLSVERYHHPTIYTLVSMSMNPYYCHSEFYKKNVNLLEKENISMFEEFKLICALKDIYYKYDLNIASPESIFHQYHKEGCIGMYIVYDKLSKLRTSIYLEEEMIEHEEKINRIIKSNSKYKIKDYVEVGDKLVQNRAIEMTNLIEMENLINKQCLSYVTSQQLKLFL